MTRRILHDLRTGLHLSLYATIGLCFAVFIAASLGWAPPRIITAITLLALFELCASTLRQRWDWDALKAAASQDLTWLDLESQMVAHLRTATTVSFLAVSLLDLLNHHWQEITQILSRKRGRVRFLLVDPESEAMGIIKKSRPEQLDDGQKFLERVHGLCRNQAFRGSLSVRKMNYIPSHIVTAIDEQLPSGTIYVTVYSYAMTDPVRPSRCVRPDRGQEYRFFCKEFASLWDAAHEVLLAADPLPTKDKP